MTNSSGPRATSYVRGNVAYLAPAFTAGAGLLAEPPTVNSEDRRPNAEAKAPPLIVTVRALPMIFSLVTRPPQAPEPSRPVIWIFLTVPTDQRRPTVAAAIFLVQAWDRITPSYGS